MPAQSQPWVCIGSGDLKAEIDPHGAQLSRLCDRDDRDLLWNGDPAVWAGRAPLLFPIVGVLNGGRYRLGAQSYALPRHGFARNRTFAVAASSASSATFRLRADAATLQVYPFRFELDAHFELQGATLLLTSTVRNLGDAALYASFGYHPALRWPLPFGEARSSHFIQFETDEPAPARRIDADGLLTPERQPTPIVERRLALTDSLFQNDVLILDQIKSRSVVYGAERGPRIRLDFADAPYLGLWTKPGGTFICIEPWHGVTDAEGFAGDFKEKTGVFALAAGQALSATMALTLLKA
jgi:galactose mutarotase-like enzyme